MSGDIASALDHRMRADRRTSRLFVTLLILAAALASVIVWLASTGPGAEGDIGGPLRLVITALVINGGLILGLASLVGRRVLTVLRSQEAGSRLHLHYMSLFALAAAVPAVVVAFFFGLLVNQGVDGWFSTRIETMVGYYAAIASQVQNNEQERINAAIGPTSRDLNTYIADLRRAPKTYEILLKQEVDQRGFNSLRVIDAHGVLLAAVPGAGAYIPPASTTLIDADSGQVPYELYEREDVARLLFKLSGEQGVYALIEAPMPKGLLKSLKESSDAVSQYRQVARVRGAVQSVFMSIYVETALLVLLGAVWLGMAVANSISGPVAKLIEAANKVAAGDLKARVPTDADLNEINILSRSFNKMTDDLDRQTSALMTAGQEAENRRTFIETVLSGVSAGVIGLDPDSRISAFNNQALRLLDISERDIRGKTLAEIAPELLEVADRAAESGSGAEAELNVLRGTVTRRLRVRAGGDVRKGLVLTFDDMTRLVAAQRNAAWRDVARRIAHEIKNPLTPIQLSAERLRRKYRKDVMADVETFDRCTETIIRQVGDIGRMVDEFSSFARMPAPRIGRCNANDLLGEAVFARRVANPDIDITIIGDLGDDPVIQCDDRMVAQALTNILKNASEAVLARVQDEPGHKGRIKACVRRQGDLVVFEIEDNGVGLPEEGRDRLIEPYVTTREKGTGLGLAIVGRILEDHGGSLTLTDARDGKGALVVLTLPQDETPRTGETPTPIHIEQV